MIAGSGISSILMISMPDFYWAIQAARLLAGWAFGISYVTTLVHGGEIVHQRQRGLVLTSVNFMLMIGVMTLGALTIAPQQEGTMPAIRLIGIVSGVIVVMTFMIMSFFVQESPVGLIMDKKDEEALKIMIKVRSETQENFDIRTQFIELKTMVEEDALRNTGLFKDQNLVPFEIILLMKIAFVLSFNWPLNNIILHSVDMSADGVDLTEIFLMTARYIPIMIGLFTIDLARRPHFLISALGSSVMLISIGIIFAAMDAPSNTLLIILWIVFQIFAGMGLGFTGDVMASEAFNSYKKLRSIGILTFTESALQIILIWSFFLVDLHSQRFIILIVFGVIMLAIVIRLFFKLPETARMSIRQSRSEFTRR